MFLEIFILSCKLKKLLTAKDLFYDIKLPIHVFIMYFCKKDLSQSLVLARYRLKQIHLAVHTLYTPKKLIPIMA